MHDSDAVVGRSIEDQIVSEGKNPHPGPELFALRTEPRVLGERDETLFYGIDEGIGLGHGLLGDMKPDREEVFLGLIGN